MKDADSKNAASAVSPARGSEDLAGEAKVYPAFVRGHNPDLGAPEDIPGFLKKTCPEYYKPAYCGRGSDVLDFIEAFNLGYAEGNVIKYVVRWKKKDGIDDLLKAEEYLRRLIESEQALARERQREEFMEKIRRFRFGAQRRGRRGGGDS